MRLFLIRHGAVVPPAPGALYGGADVPLSDLGKVEARAAAAALTELLVDHVIASPLARARYGGEQVVAGRELALELDDGLREIDRGRWFGLTPAQIEQRFPGDLDAHRNDPLSWRGHGGESLADLRDRVLAVRDRLLQQFRGRRVVLVSHMMPTRALLAHAKGLDFDAWPKIQLPTASISLIDYQTDHAEQRPAVARVSGYKPDGLAFAAAFPQLFG